MNNEENVADRNNRERRENHSSLKLNATALIVDVAVPRLKEDRSTGEPDRRHVHGSFVPIHRPPLTTTSTGGVIGGRSCWRESASVAVTYVTAVGRAVPDQHHEIASGWISHLVGSSSSAAAIFEVRIVGHSQGNSLGSDSILETHNSNTQGRHESSYAAACGTCLVGMLIGMDERAPIVLGAYRRSSLQCSSSCRGRY